MDKNNTYISSGAFIYKTPRPLNTQAGAALNLSALSLYIVTFTFGLHSTHWVEACFKMLWTYFVDELV